MNRTAVGLLLVLIAMVGFSEFHAYRWRQQQDRNKQSAADLITAKRRLNEAGESLEASVAATGLQAHLHTHHIETSVTPTTPGVLAVQGRAEDRIAIKKLLADPAYASLLREEKITLVLFRDETGVATAFTVN